MGCGIMGENNLAFVKDTDDLYIMEYIFLRSCAKYLKWYQIKKKEKETKATFRGQEQSF